MFYVWVDGRIVEDVAFIECTAYDTHTHGFSMNGINQPKETRNIRFENCVARRCGYGVAGGSRSDDITGFDLQEDNDVDGVQVINCRAEDNWQSGFHFEPGEDKGTIKKAISLSGCRAERNGQRNPAAYPYISTFLSGFYVHFNAAVTDCVSVDNKNAGFYVEGGSSVVFTRCSDTGSTYGWKVVKNARNIRLQDCTTTDAERWAFWSAYATNITLARFRQVGAGGDRGFQSMLGWYYDVPAYQQPVTSSSFEITASGDRSLGIINQAGTGNTYQLRWEGDPTITGITPAAGNQGQTIKVSIAGTNFQPNAQVKLTGGTTTILATGETTSGTTTITCTVAVPSTAYLGYYTVSVQNPGMTTWVSRANAFRVLGPSTVTGISPVSMARGATRTDVSISGTNFVSGTQVKLTGGTTTILATAEATTGTTKITCTVAVPSTAYLGSYTVSVQSPGTTTWVSRAGAFSVLGPSTVAGISPTTANRGTTITATVTGTNLASGAQVRVTGGTTTILATGETTNAAGTQITCTVAVPSTAYLGSYTVAVQNPGTSTWIPRASAFKVLGPLTVTGISPTTAKRGTTITATVTGTNFASGAQVRLTGGGTTISATGETLVSASQIRCTVAVPSTAYLGYYAVSVQNKGMTTWIPRASAFRTS